eukprot:Selendium_serpulae@DN3759_c0_g1_i1.p1
MDDNDPSQALAKTNMWIVQHAHHKSLLMDKLKPEYLSHMCVLIFLDMSQPWSIKEDLRYWLEFAHDVLCELIKDLPVDEADAKMNKLSHYVSNYKQKVCPEKAEEYAKRHMDDLEADQALDPHGALMMNMGVPIVVCIAKSDTFKLLDTKLSRGHIDVISAHVRNCCIPYGAALIYANAKTPKNTINIDLLYRYLMHRIYGFHFREPADLEGGDSLFLPSGWDTVKEIEAFALTTVADGLTKPFEAIIVKPMAENVLTDVSPVRNEDMNTFLCNALAANPASVAVPRESKKEQRDEAHGDRHERERDRDRDRDRDRHHDRKRETDRHEEKKERREKDKGDKEKGDKQKKKKKKKKKYSALI